MGAQAVRLSNVDIDNALNNKEFEVLFQPIFDLGNGALARVESFVRWRHPTLGVLPPGAFISFFETQGRMSELTRYVLAGSLAAYTDWRGPYAPGFSINLALSDLSDDAFATHFAKVLRDRDFSPDLVTLECPMPPVDLDLKLASDHFARLAETGARLAIEVRGRANDLLRNIDPFPFDEIKTGGSAILRFARTVRGPGLSAIADLLDIANNSNAAITAVGVEDQASLAALRGLGFTAVQGNHLAKVGALNEFRPGKVNDVRKLLDLEPLSADSLTALFRTAAPSPTAAQSPQQPDAGAADEEVQKSDDALVESLNKRFADVEEAAPGAVATDETRKTKIREKAKALALAKRAKARDARKTAAIDRAKAKMAHAKQKAEEAKPVDSPIENAPPPSSAPRDLQEKLTKEFSFGDAPLPEPTAKKKATPKQTAPNNETPARASATPKSDAQNTPAPHAATDVNPIRKETPKVASKQPVRSDQPETSPDTPETVKPGGVAPVSSKAPPRKNEPGQTVGADATGNAPPVKRAPVQTKPRDSVALEKFSMSVGSARAHFRPGLRVGNPALKSDGPTPQTQPVRASDRSASKARLPVKGIETSAGGEAITETIAAPINDAGLKGSPLRTPDELKTVSLEQGDLHSSLQSPIAQPKPRKKRRKNILTRKYRLMPTHFWPKSWKQKRRTASEVEKTGALATNDAASVEVKV